MTIRTRTALALVVSLVTTASAHAESNDHPHTPALVTQTSCGATDGRLPPNVQVHSSLQRQVQEMLQRSEDFRRQCGELAANPTVYVRVRVSSIGMPARYCARSVVLRMTDGPLLIFVEIERTVNWAEWLAHEFEHVLEQAEGLRLKDLRARKDSWESGDAVFETARAIGVGRAVRKQMRRKPAAIAANN
jgi:hypothetical protein